MSSSTPARAIRVPKPQMNQLAQFVQMRYGGDLDELCDMAGNAFTFLSSLALSLPYVRQQHSFPTTAPEGGDDRGGFGGPRWYARSLWERGSSGGTGGFPTSGGLENPW